MVNQEFNQIVDPMEGGYEGDVDEGDVTDVDDVVGENDCYGPDIPRSNREIEVGGEVVDTNYLFWVSIMRNLYDDWDGDEEGWSSGFDEYRTNSEGNVSEDSDLGGVISSLHDEVQQGLRPDNE
ncbi:hypothetical protein ZOSMA_2G02130 [Zostera marina]|uniref:Uncharacterized protein n=1 Tax=Zostera marina TaxID=29655 RepID=A0A0K9PAV1_ZOSMR|nr:hypothetical protein ZOSMA_2G02130 [Zostera marina]